MKNFCFATVTYSGNSVLWVHRQVRMINIVKHQIAIKKIKCIYGKLSFDQLATASFSPSYVGDDVDVFGPDS